MHDVELKSGESRDRRGARVELRGGGKSDVVDEIAAAVVIVADEGRAGRNAVARARSVAVDAMLDQPVDNDVAESVVADRADENAVRPRSAPPDR